MNPTRSKPGGIQRLIRIAGRKRWWLIGSMILAVAASIASLDPENELLIQQAIGDLVKNKTVVVIAHRLNTITQADKIIVIDQGKVAEEGDHSHLLLNRGLYWKLWNEQQRIKGWKF
ncbi:MAG: hypothetical protein KBA26_04315 [Candidatus Delongbacteria bacterium]|nr:hypothetical protein [Candidatus Delongbacteria bacterium]